MRTLLISLLFFSMYPGWARADDGISENCTYRDLETSPMGEIRNQLEVSSRGGCYAVAAADMVSYFAGQRVATQEFFSGEGGQPYFAILSALMQGGFCPDRLPGCPESQRRTMGLSPSNLRNHRTRQIKTPDHLRQVIDAELEQNRIVLVTFSLAAMAHSWTGAVIHHLQGIFFGSGSEIHASTIVGRVKDGERCLYRLRGTWGASCGGFSQKICEGGYLNISGNELGAILRDVTTIDPASVLTSRSRE